MTLTQRFHNRRLIVDTFALTFGIGAWLGVNCIFVQLPLLVNNAPEGWNLPAFMTMTTQIANLGPIIYSFYAKWVSTNLYRRFHLLPIPYYYIMSQLSVKKKKTNSLSSFIIIFFFLYRDIESRQDRDSVSSSVTFPSSRSISMRIPYSELFRECHVFQNLR